MSRRLSLLVAVLGFALTAATSGPAAVPSPSISSIASRFAGIWRCDGYAPDDSGTEEYMREAGDTIALVGVFDTGKAERDRFSYDAARGVWQLSTLTTDAPLIAQQAAGDRWVFSGNEGDHRDSHAVQVIYTSLGPAAFRREHQVRDRDAWVDDAETVCRQTASPAPLMAASRRPVAVAERTPSATPSPAPPTAPPRPAGASRPNYCCAVTPTPRPTPTPRRTPSPRPSGSPGPSGSPRPSGSPGPAGSPRPQGSPSSKQDRAYRLVGGTWDCETIAGNSAPHTYRLERDGTISLHTVLTDGTKSFNIDERYRFDRSHQIWTATTTGGSYSSTASPWFGDKWTFDGIARIDGDDVPVRMIYTDLDERAFRRDFRQRHGDTWQTVASETCKRN